MWAALNYLAMNEQEGTIHLFATFLDILLQQLAGSYLLAHASLSKLMQL